MSEEKSDNKAPNKKREFQIAKLMLRKLSEVPPPDRLWIIDMLARWATEAAKDPEQVKWDINNRISDGEYELMRLRKRLAQVDEAKNEK